MRSGPSFLIGVGAGSIVIVMVFCVAVDGQRAPHQTGRPAVPPGAQSRPLSNIVPFPGVTPAPEPEPVVPELEVSEFTVRMRETGFVEADGRVRNVSNAVLEDVQAAVRFLGTDDRYLGHELWLIDVDPLGPGQESTFRIMGDMPDTENVTLDFKLMDGRFLEVRRADRGE